MEQELQPQPEEILEVVEIEIYAIEEKPLPHAKRYIIRVDKEKVTVHKPELTGAEILALVKKTHPHRVMAEHDPLLSYANFRQNTPGGEEMRERRLTHAASLITTLDVSVKQAMIAAGFSDPSHFTKSYKKRFGRVPSLAHKTFDAVNLQSSPDCGNGQQIVETANTFLL